MSVTGTDPQVSIVNVGDNIVNELVVYKLSTGLCTKLVPKQHQHQVSCTRGNLPAGMLFI